MRLFQKSVVNGVDYFVTITVTPVSAGVGITGLAKLCGVRPFAIRYWLKAIANSKAELPRELANVSRVNYENPMPNACTSQGNEIIMLPASVSEKLLEYFSRKGKLEAKEFLSRLDSQGLSWYIQMLTGSLEQSKLDESLSNLKKVYSFLKDIGGLDSKALANLRQAALDLVIDGKTPQDEEEIVTISERAKNLNFSPSTEQYKRIGMVTKKLYMDAYGVEPSKRNRIINGRKRLCNFYTESHIPLIDKAVNQVCGEVKGLSLV